MPLSVADSDNDAEELSIEPSIERRASKCLVANETETISVVTTVNGTNEHSTGSTERLRSQIRSAERHLLDPSINMASSKGQSSMSPAAQAGKRRSMSVFGSQLLTSPEKAASRSMSMKSCSSERYSARINDGESVFAAFRNDGPSSAVSQGGKYTKHSGNASSHGLPSGSIQADFINHEPAVMFRGTGDTLADGASSQDRMVEAAVGSKRGLDMSGVKSIPSDEAGSSSFPWSTSEATPAVKETIGASRRQTSGAGGEPPDDTQGPDHNESFCQAQIKFTPRHEIQVAANEDGESATLSATASNEVDDTFASNRIRSPANTCTLRSSPRVEIFAQRAKSPMPADTMLSSDTQRTIRGRKRKPPQELMELTDFDDSAVGLPKERYEPRLSRRRATQLAEEVRDWSVVPEKALKAGAKRRRTEATATSIRSTQETLAVIAQWACPSKAKINHKVESPEKLQKHNITESSPSEVVNAAVTTLNETPAQMAQECSLSKVALNSDEAFVKPAPKQNPSRAKSKRAHTTIFEDHVDFSRPERRLTLSQQQAARTLEHKSQDDDAGQVSQRMKRKIADNESTGDHEDTSLSKEKVVKVDHQSSTRRSSGRLSQVALTAHKNEDNAKAPHSPEVEVDNIDNVTGSAAMAHGNTRLPKNRGRSPNDAEIQQQRDFTELRQEPASRQSAVGTENAGLKLGEPSSDQPPLEKVAMPTSSKPSTPVVQAPTPSPERVTAKSEQIPYKIKQQVHSPIKSSSKAVFRVGLSKRQRIPPLLRTMKPQKK